MGSLLGTGVRCGAKSDLLIGLPDRGGTGGGNPGAGGSAGTGGAGGGAMANGGAGGSGGFGALAGSGGGAQDAGVVDAAPCVLRDEVCNGVDDDCDGWVDEDLGIVPIGGPMVLRDVEGETGDCSTCRWALDPFLASSESGLFAAWHLSFNGTAPMPNLFGVVLDGAGRPVESPRSFSSRTGQTLRFAVSPGDSSLAAFCERDGSRDRAVSFTHDGFSAGPVLRRGPDTSTCRAVSDVDVTWTGERFVLSWSDASPPFGVVVEVLDASGSRLEDSFRLDVGGGNPVRAAVGHGEVALLTAAALPPPGTTLVLHRLDALARPIGVPVEIPRLTSFQDSALVAVPGGWLVYAWGVGGAFQVSISRDGVVGDESPLRFDQRTAGYSLFPRPRGGHVSIERRSQTRALPPVIEWWRADGTLEATWVGPADDSARTPHVAFRDGSTWVIYGTPPETFEANQVRLRRFGCSDVPAPECGGADVDDLRSRFEPCGDGGRVGQSAMAPGATCEAVCCALGFAGCSHRAAQASFDACGIENPVRTGECGDVFQQTWSSQCICAN